MRLYFTLFILISLTAAIDGQSQYWQQHVEYDMDVHLDVNTHQYSGHQVIQYTNHSPDTLRRVFYHLFMNAFQPGSMMDVRNQNILDPDPKIAQKISEASPEEQGYLHVLSLQQDGRALRYEEVGTILEVELDQPILPGGTTELSMEFEGQVPIQIRRNGRDNAEGIDYSMSQWYPKLCEYDDHGWHANPYIYREFYGVWGDFDVRITLDKDYIVGGSGVLQNADDIGYGYSDRPSPKSVDGEVTWHFLAENVHDFAWGADPDYTHVIKEAADGTEMHFFYVESESTEAWKELPDIMADAFAYIGDRYGDYPYPVYSFIQGGDGGMEYPMATLITGHRRIGSLVGVSVHELLHSWHQMILATDEARYAWMDEGFTSYASAETVNHLRKLHGFGQYSPSNNLHTRRVRGFIQFLQSGLEEPLSTRSDHFNTNTAYGVGAYTKGALYLLQMRYIIGDDNFDRVMLRYFDEWKFKHPNPYDFMRIAEKKSGLELDWFNEYFINTTHRIDYALDTNWTGDQSTIPLKRLGVFPMPVDIKVDYDDGTSSHHTIPLHIMRGAKHSEGGIQYTVEPDWPWTHPDYDFELANPERVIRIEIDPTMRLVDVDRSNNVWER